MTRETLEQTFRFLMRSPGLLDEGSSIIWHCGEPLAVPLEFYQYAYSLLDEVRHRVHPIPTCFSTNATLLTDQWCEFLKARPSIKMRVSIDGPQWLHDLNRVERSGRGTHEKVMRGINLLRSSNIPFDVLCVLTNRSLDAPEELWRFFQSIGARGVGFCVEEILGEHRMSSLAVTQAISRLKNFYSKWLDLRARENPGFYVRELDEEVKSIPALLRSKEPFLRMDNVPFSLVTISWQGDISLFSPELLDVKHDRYHDFVFGNVATHTVEDILSSVKLREVYNDIMDGVQQCREVCKYSRICGGGFPVSKLLENGTFQSAETLTCRLRVQAVSDLIMHHLLNKSQPARRSIAPSAMESSLRSLQI
jgi:uncharacterized protein